MTKTSQQELDDAQQAAIIALSTMNERAIAYHTTMTKYPHSDAVARKLDELNQAIEFVSEAQSSIAYWEAVLAGKVNLG